MIVDILKALPLCVCSCQTFKNFSCTDSVPSVDSTVFNMGRQEKSLILNLNVTIQPNLPLVSL